MVVETQGDVRKLLEHQAAITEEYGTVWQDALYPVVQQRHGNKFLLLNSAHVHAISLNSRKILVLTFLKVPG